MPNWLAYTLCGLGIFFAIGLITIGQLADEQAAKENPKGAGTIELVVNTGKGCWITIEDEQGEESTHFKTVGCFSMSRGDEVILGQNGDFAMKED